MTERISAAALSKLKWRTRRGMLENDLFIERFFAKYESQLTQDHERGMYALMDLSDNDLMDLILKRKTLSATDSEAFKQARKEAAEVLKMLHSC